MSINCESCQLRLKDGIDLDQFDFQEWKHRQYADGLPLCPSCFGLLQYGAGISQTVIEAHKASQHSDPFNVAIALQFPPSILLRHMIEREVLTEERLAAAESKGDAASPHERPWEVRDILKHFLTALIPDCQIRSNFPSLNVEVEVKRSAQSSASESPIIRQVLTLMGGKSHKKSRVGGVETNLEDIVSISNIYKFIDRKNAAALRELFGLSDLREVLKTGEPLTDMPTLSVGFRRDAIYLIGKYNKFTREFGQSPWTVNDDDEVPEESEQTSTEETPTEETPTEETPIEEDEKVCGGGTASMKRRNVQSSVFDKICKPLCALFGNSPLSKCSLSAAGREDVDVRMLGSGRPFVIQLSEAKSLQPLLDFHDSPATSALRLFTVEGGDVQVRPGGVRHVDKKVLDWLQWSAEQHEKIYKCLVWSATPVNAEMAARVNDTRNLKVFQKTPIRVLHRRTEAIRNKVVYSMQCEPINPHFFFLTINASAGAYIKEFVHGDFGRTRPSLGSVLFDDEFVECDILQLDVMDLIQDAEEDYVAEWDRLSRTKAEYAAAKEGAK